MADGYVLSEKDRDLLKHKLGSLHPWPNIHGEQEPGLDHSSDVFVARVQSSLGSISALADDSDNGFYEPGCSMCDLFQIVPGDSTHLYNLIQVSGLSVPVFNVSSSDIGDEWIVVAMDRHGHWVALAPSPPGALYYQLLTDIQGNSYLAFANPGVYLPAPAPPHNCANRVRVRHDPSIVYNESTETCEGPFISPDYTVIVADTGQTLGAWIGDWVEAVNTGETMQAYYPSPYPGGASLLGTFPIYEITARLSPQTHYTGKLLESLLYGLYAQADLTINERARTTLALLKAGVATNDPWLIDWSQPLLVYDFLLSSGQFVYGDIEETGPTILAQYFPAIGERTWRLIGAPCTVSET